MMDMISSVELILSWLPAEKLGDSTRGEKHCLLLWFRGATQGYSLEVWFFFFAYFNEINKEIDQFNPLGILRFQAKVTWYLWQR